MILGTTTDKLQLTTAQAGDIDVLASFADMDDTTKAVTVDRQLTTIATAATTDIVAAPASGFSRKVKWISISNTHATVTNTLTVSYDANGTDFEVDKFSLAPGERASFVEGRGLRVYDTEGREKLANLPAAVYNASTADQVTAATDVYLTNSNLLIGGRVKQGTRFEWKLTCSKGTASTATPILTMRFGTAGAIADTARCTMTGPVQTAVADEGTIIVQGLVRVHSATGVVQGSVATVHRAASAAGFGNFCARATSATFDTTVTNLQVGLSFNGGTAAAWTFQTVECEAFNLA